MGFNTTVVILNDRLGDIEKDEGFGKKLVQAISSLSIPEEHRRHVPGLHGTTVLETHHMDVVVSVDVGGNTAVVVGERYDPKFPRPGDRETHECYACGRKHAGYEEKYCDICGKAAQERKTLYEALHLIDIATQDAEDEKAKRARELAIEALIAAPVGERMHVLPWRDIYEGKLDIDEAYAQLEERDHRRKEKG